MICTFICNTWKILKMCGKSKRVDCSLKPKGHSPELDAPWQLFSVVLQSVWTSLIRCTSQAGTLASEELIRCLYALMSRKHGRRLLTQNPSSAALQSYGWSPLSESTWEVLGGFKHACTHESALTHTHPHHTRTTNSIISSKRMSDKSCLCSRPIGVEEMRG